MTTLNGTHTPLGPLGKPDAESNDDAGLATLARQTVVVVLIGVMILGVAYLCYCGINVLLLCFAGLLLALFLAMIAQPLSRATFLPYPLALAIAIIALFSLGGGLVWLLSSRLSSQASHLSEKIPVALDQLRIDLMQYPGIGNFLEQLPRPGEVLAKTADFPRVAGFIGGVAESLVAILVVLFVGIFGAAEPAVYRTGLVHLCPKKHRRRMEEALDALVYNLRRWILVQGLLMFLVGSGTALGLWLIGVPEALVLGLMTGLLELIPYVGPWLAVVPSALIAFLIGPWQLFMTLGLYLGVHMLEAYLLVPLLQRRAVMLPPALGLVTQLLLGRLFGIMGLIVAAPLTLAVLVLVKMLYVQDTLDDQAVEVPGEPGGGVAAAQDPLSARGL